MAATGVMLQGHRERVRALVPSAQCVKYPYRGGWRIVSDVGELARGGNPNTAWYNARIHLEAKALEKERANAGEK